MAISPSYPGVYLQEVSSGVRTISGVSTSVTAFVGYTTQGPLNKAIQIFDFGSYERQFGRISSDSELGYAVKQYFLNGGSEAWIVRVAQGTSTASVALLQNDAAPLTVLNVEASSPGVWGNYLKLDIDYNTTNPLSTFNLTATQYSLQNGQLILTTSEKYRNLSMNSSSPGYVESVVNSTSTIIRVTRPLTSGDIDTYLNSAPSPYSLSGDLSAFPALQSSGDKVAITLDGDGPYEVSIRNAGGDLPANLSDLATNLQTNISALKSGFALFRVQRVDASGANAANGNYLKATWDDTYSGISEASAIQFANAASQNAAQILKLGIINGGRELTSAAGLRPSQTGTTTLDLYNLALGTHNNKKMTPLLTNGSSSIPGTEFTFNGSGSPTISSLVTQLQNHFAGQTDAALKSVQVQLIGTSIRFICGHSYADYKLSFVVSDTNANLASALGIWEGQTTAGNSTPTSDRTNVNVQAFSVGTGKDVQGSTARWGAQAGTEEGNDGQAPTTAVPFTAGSSSNKVGLYGLEDISTLNLLCLPITAEWVGDSNYTQTIALVSAAATYCESRRAFLLIDPPKSINTVSGIQGFMETLTKTSYAAVYFPSVQVPDPANGNRLRTIGASGTLAGLYARTDSNRGVWKAPAGTEASLVNVQSLTYNLTEAESGALNPLGINGLRVLPVYGRVCWGARTLKGADQQADEYKYVPVRRLALNLEESLFRGLQWVVFEPNDEPLWAQIRLNVGAYLHGLFRQGAFQGKTPSQAYFVKCDSETTTQNDINQGIVNILVGFAPLKPAEFVVIQLQQIAGQSVA